MRTQCLTPAFLAPHARKRALGARDKVHGLVPLLQQVLDHLARAIELVVIDRRAQRVLQHRNEHRLHAGQRFKGSKVRRHAVHDHNHTVHRQCTHTRRCALEGIRMPIYFSEGDGVAVFVGGGGKALHTVEVAGAGNVEHSDADGLKLTAAQRSTGKIGAIPQLAHGGTHALLGLGAHAGRIVHRTRDCLLRDARETRHILNGNRFFNSGHRSIFLCRRCHWWHPTQSFLTPSSISNASPTIRSPPKTYRSPTFLLPQTAFGAQMLTLPLCKHRATGRLKRLRIRNRRFAGTGTTGSCLFLCRKMATSTFWQLNAKSYHRC